MSKMKILQFPIAASKGGITQYIIRNWEYIDKNSFLFDFATMSKSLDFEDDLKKQGCSIYHIPVYAEEDQKGFDEAFMGILKRGRYDAVHLHTKQWKSFRVEELAREAGVRKIIVHAHSTGVETADEEGRRKETELHQSCIRRLGEGIATDFWSCSMSASRWLYADRIPEDRIVMLPNAIDTDRFSYDMVERKKMRESLGIKDSFVLGFVGRIEKVKNPDFLIELFDILHRWHPELRLLMVGDGTLREDIERRCAAKCIGEKVIFVGRKKNVEDYMMAMDVLLLPSVFEGFPITLVEAQCAGLKCICSMGVSEETDITGNVNHIDTCNMGAWISTIEEMMLLGYERVSKRAELADKGFDIHRQIKRVEELYRE